MSLAKITPEEAKRLVDAGATLIDVRAPAEHARESIPGARNLPLGQRPSRDLAGPVVFHCRSGMRTSMKAAELAGSVDCEAYLLEGGIDAWKRAGLPVKRDASLPIEIMRQVQIAAGSLVALSFVLGFVWSTVFFLVAALVGCGLIFAGVTGWCGMAKVLELAPWNRRRPGEAI
jgi:rhodanese-related sulfurtransferase